MVGAIVLIGAASAAEAQETFFQASGVVLGLSRYHYAYSGTAATVSPVFRFRVTHSLALEALMPMHQFTYTYTFAGAVHHRLINVLYPELAGELVRSVGTASVFLGGGLGWSTAINGSPPTGFSIHALTGARFTIGGHRTFRLEGRLRSIRGGVGQLP